MDAARLTYKKLFALLASLGFKESLPSRSVPKGPRVFVHDSTDTVLLYRNTTSKLVSPADVLSTEVHLHANNLMDQSLESMLSAEPVMK